MNTPAMNYRLLGRSGLRVSELCLGTMTFGEDWGWGSGRDESRRVYDAFRAAGGNFIDTANLYTNGSSETLLGDFMTGHRDEVVLATKYTNAPGIFAGKTVTDPNAGGNQRKNMTACVEASLTRLKTDYIDLYWLHCWDGLTPAEEVMRAFDDLVRAGKVLYVGVSDAPAWVVAKSNTLAELRGWTRYVGLQIEYSLLERTVERDLVPMAAAEQLTVLAWSPLKSGVLTGKYLPENVEASKGEGARMHTEMMKSFRGEESDAIHRQVREVIAVAKELGATPAQVSLAWLLARPVPTIPILGARRVSQLQDNLTSLNVTLSPEHLARLDKATAVPLGFPHDFLQTPGARAIIHAGLRDRIRA